VSGKVCNFVGPRVLTLEYEFETLGTHVSSVHHELASISGGIELSPKG